jgi:predicted HicB family RNase H-like nuclease
MCAEEGTEAEKPFKGTFNIRLDPDLHKQLVVNALDKGMTLNAYVKNVLKKAVFETHA